MAVVRWVVTLVLALAWMRADAASLAMGDVRAEQDVQVEADAVGLLVRSALSGVRPLVVLPRETSLRTAGDAAKTLGASHAVMLDLGREGTGLRLTVALVSGDGTRDIAYIRAGDGDVFTLAQGAVDKVVAAVGASKVEVSEMPLGALRPYAMALRAATPDDAARALAEASPVTVLPVNAAKQALADVPSKATTPAGRALAARAVRDAKTLELLGAETTPIATAARALGALVTSDMTAAEAALAAKAPSTGLLALARIVLAEGRGDDKHLAETIATGLSTDQAIACLAVASTVAPARLDARTHKMLLAFTERLKPSAGVASAIGLGAAISGVDLPRALALIDARELDAAHLASLETVLAKRTDATGARLRAELAMRKADGTEPVAIRDLARIAPNDKRTHRYMGWLLASEGKHEEAAAELAKSGSNREQVRELAAARQLDAALLAMGHAPASPEELVVAVHVAIAEKKLDVAGTTLALAEKVAPLSPTIDLATVALAAAPGAKVDAQDLAVSKQVLTADTSSTATLAGSAAAPVTTVEVTTGSAAPTESSVQLSAIDARPIEPLVSALTGLQRLGSRRLAVAEITWEPKLWSLHVTDTRPLRAALTKLLSAPPYRLRIVDVFRRVPDGPVAPSVLNDLSNDADGVLLYRLEPGDGGAHVSLMLYVRGEAEAATVADVVEMPGLVKRDSDKVLVLSVLGGLVVLALLIWVAWPRGRIKVIVKRAPDIEQEVLCVSITKSPRRPLVENPEAFHKDTRKDGAVTKPRFATLIASGATFKVSTGHWYVHLYGAYVRGDAIRAVPAACSQEVDVKRGKLAELDFDLASKLAEVTVEIVANPRRGVAVWADDRTDEKLFTDAAGIAILQLPVGTHMIHIDAHGSKLERSMQIASLKMQRLTINVERELRLQAGIEIDLGPASAKVTETPVVDAVEPVVKMKRASSPVAHAATEHLGTATAPATAATNALPSATRGGPQFARAATPVPGQMLLGRYRIVAELGRGAMGIVQRAWDDKLERDVAIKQMADDLRTNPEAMRLFTQEAKALAQLNHTNIVGMYDQITDDSGVYMVMEYVDGKPLASLIEARGAMPWRDALTIIDQVCAGLAFAHARRVIHRDIKPANIFIGADHTVKLGDFGLARVMREVTIRRTEIRGTPLYMAPEQITGTDVDHRTDLYAVGCTLFELLTGRPPFIDGDILYAQMHQPPPTASALASDIPAGLDALLTTLLAKPADDRPGSANEVRTAIRQLFAG